MALRTEDIDLIDKFIKKELISNEKSLYDDLYASSVEFKDMADMLSGLSNYISVDRMQMKSELTLSYHSVLSSNDFDAYHPAKSGSKIIRNIVLTITTIAIIALCFYAYELNWFGLKDKIQHSVQPMKEELEKVLYYKTDTIRIEIKKPIIPHKYSDTIPGSHVIISDTVYVDKKISFGEKNNQHTLDSFASVRPKMMNKKVVKKYIPGERDTIFSITGDKENTDSPELKHAHDTYTWPLTDKVCYIK